MPRRRSAFRNDHRQQVYDARHPLPSDEPAKRGPPYFHQQTTASVSYTFLKNGVPQIDARNNVYYMAAGNSPAMMEKNVGQGSQYLGTYRDANGDYLDGAKSYRLHVPPDIPIKNFWSVVVYDALSRSEL
jgi:hypothetical protein